ncbi:uncharacterized protein BO80DRAFT_83079 [Aspergillus ibericus CBS 121593]|uniref:Uncharacterized protein n=1 Tax=Aspergillus ibericus CBS 121593 TaxID=1448316 RepID=A0A395HDQ7_9EURO|nr:hypothetical protein BO80DRAFT_83079 [Aspergillus ibericus CBS 121593]RAL05870.1 hypothetical protein BO80DRAFT_83079 [Aspergillus ibericus CBS 121593]
MDPFVLLFFDDFLLISPTTLSLLMYFIGFENPCIQFPGLWAVTGFVVLNKILFEVRS